MAPTGGGHLVHAVEVHAVEVGLGPLVVGVHLGFGVRAVLVLQLLPGGEEWR